MTVVSVRTFLIHVLSFIPCESSYLSPDLSWFLEIFLVPSICFRLLCVDSVWFSYGCLWLLLDSCDSSWCLLIALRFLYFSMISCDVSGFPWLWFVVILGPLWLLLASFIFSLFLLTATGFCRILMIIFYSACFLVKSWVVILLATASSPSTQSFFRKKEPVAWHQVNELGKLDILKPCQ